MSSAAPVINRHFLNKEESFMYDREANFPMEDTRNEARIVRGSGESKNVVAVFPLPHDLQSSDRNDALEIHAERRVEDGVVEIDLRCRGALIGVAVSVSPTARRER